MKHTKKQYSSNPFGEGTLERGSKLIDTMKEEKRNKWEEVIMSIDLTHNSYKAWQTIRKLSNETLRVWSTPTKSHIGCLSMVEE